MEVITEKKQDRQMLMILHLSQLLNFVSGFGGFVVPLILWQLKKEEIEQMDAQGKEVINFQISFFIYSIIGAILMLVFIGFFIFGAVCLLAIIFPIINAIKASNGEPVNYPLTIKFFQ